MANSTALSKEECSLLKSSVANWFDQRCSISMIKVLYEELVTSKQDLHKSTTTLELINLVNTYNGFSQNDPSLLLATINVTGQHGIWNKIEKLKLPELCQTRTVSMFSEFRQKVMRLGLKMTDIDVKRISHLYEETKFGKYEDSWSLIIDLERYAHLSNENMTSFIRTLSENSLGHLIYTIDGVEQQNVGIELPRTAKTKRALVAVLVAIVGIALYYYYFAINVSDDHEALVVVVAIVGIALYYYYPVITVSDHQDVATVGITLYNHFASHVSDHKVLVAVLVAIVGIALYYSAINVSDHKDQLVMLNVSCKGRTLHLKDEDIKLEIPSGAIEEGKKVKISLENIWEEIDIPLSHPLNSLISPVVKCGPEGTIFNKPCLLSFPHYARNEEFWEFTLLVKDRIQDKWKRIALKSNDTDINFTLNSGLCCVTLNHFCFFSFVGRLINVVQGKKSTILLVFGKRIENHIYQLQIRLCGSGDKTKICKEHERHEEYLVRTPVDILTLYKDMKITVAVPNQEWNVQEEEQIITTDYVWSQNPEKTYYLERNNSSTNTFWATVLLSQGDANAIPNVPICCDIRKSNSNPDQHSPENVSLKNGIQSLFAKENRVLIICFIVVIVSAFLIYILHDTVATFCSSIVLALSLVTCGYQVYKKIRGID
ncbi:uncharacterized protein [Antedon mediterranea]|uniref:uncharacterized protein isoform X2 n=1 Tax=Antedon mediterranea TaxID=105859 RepID=UPI003AF46A33